MSTRLQQRLAELGEQKRAGFVPFIMAGDPSMETTRTLLHALASHGADVIELGIPFSDPTADGPIIQAAGLRALKAGFTLDGLFELVRDFRAHDAHTPLILMGYANPVFHRGMDRFMQEAAQAGVDGLILVDIPAEERAPFQRAAEAHALDLIPLIAPTSLGARLATVTRGCSGFAYFIAIKGITGTHSANYDTLKGDVEAIRHSTNLPIAVGFGIKTPEDVAAVSPYADLIVVGSALVKTLEESGSAEAMLQRCQQLSRAVKPR